MTQASHYRGGCISARYKEPLYDKLTPLERKVNEIELEFSLSKVRFHKFRAAVKKYGYLGRLQENHLEAISDLINLDIDTMKRNPQCIDNLIYNDPEFTFQGGNYDPYRLQLIGYVYCQYSDLETHMNDMWFLVNPKLDEAISKDRVVYFLQDLLYVAIDQRIKILESQENSDPIILKYFKECQSAKESTLQRILDEFSEDENVDKGSFLLVMGQQFSRTYAIRQFCLSSPEKQEDEEEDYMMDDEAMYKEEQTMRFLENQQQIMEEETKQKYTTGVQ